MKASTTRRRLLLGTAGAAFAASTIRSARAQSAPIRLGFLGPLSGPAQIVGNELRIGGETAKSHYNSAGGILGRQIEIVYGDDRGDPNITVSAAHELNSQGINMVFGMALLANIMALLPLLPQFGMIAQVNGATDERLSHEFYSRNLFVATPNNYIRQNALAEQLAIHYPDCTDWVSAVQDTTQSRDSWARFGKSLVAAYEVRRGKKITLEPILTAKVGTVDFKPPISQLAASPAKGLFHSLVGADGVSFFQQARAFDLDKKFTVIAENALDMDLPRALKHNMPGNVLSLSFWSPNVNPSDPEGQELVRAYTAATHDPYPHGLAALGYCSAQMYLEAIREVGGTETAKIIDAMERIKFKTIRGPAYFRKEDHQLLAQTCIVHFVAQQNDPGWGVQSVVTVDDAAMVNPATPGVPMAI